MNLPSPFIIHPTTCWACGGGGDNLPCSLPGCQHRRTPGEAAHIPSGEMIAVFNAGSRPPCSSFPAPLWRPVVMPMLHDCPDMMYGDASLRLPHLAMLQAAPWGDEYYPGQHRRSQPGGAAAEGPECELRVSALDGHCSSHCQEQEGHVGGGLGVVCRAGLGGISGGQGRATGAWGAAGQAGGCPEPWRCLSAKATHTAAMASYMSMATSHGCVPGYSGLISGPMQVQATGDWASCSGASSEREERGLGTVVSLSTGMHRQ